MSGKHDPSAKADASAKLLMTGPIVIRGLGRGVKDALLPGKANRHRAVSETGGAGSAPAEREALVEGDSTTEENPQAYAQPDALGHTEHFPAEEPRMIPDEHDDPIDGGPAAPGGVTAPDASVEVDSGPNAGPLHPTDASIFSEADAAPNGAQEPADDGTPGPDPSHEDSVELLVETAAAPVEEEPDEPAGVAVTAGRQDRQDRAQQAALRDDGDEQLLPTAGTTEDVPEASPPALEARAATAPSTPSERATDANAEPRVLDSAPGAAAEDEAVIEKPARAKRRPPAKRKPESEPESVDARPAARVGEPVKARAPRGGSSMPGRDQPVTDAGGALRTTPASGVEFFEQALPHAEEPERHVNPDVAVGKEPEQASAATDPLPPKRSNPAAAKGTRPARAVRAPLEVAGVVAAASIAVPAASAEAPTASAAAAAPGPATSASTAAPVASAFVAGASGRVARSPARRSGTARARLWRDRLGRETIGIAVLVVLALVCAGLIAAVVVKTRNDAAIAAREAAAYTPPPLMTPTPAATGPAVAVIGDGTVSTAATGLTAGERWPTLLQSLLFGTVTSSASGSSGYATGATDSTFVARAQKVRASSDVVVFFGGADDAAVSALSLAKAATSAYAAAAEQAPDAEIVVVGPVLSGGTSAADLTRIRQSLRSAARISKATWVDPIESKWLPASSRNASSASALTRSDEKAIAAKMKALVVSVVR